MSAARRLVVLTAALVLFRLGSAVVLSEPGYTDAYYYVDVAKRLAAGQGLTADFVWNWIEASGPLPVPSHRFWMPLATALQALGIKVLPFLDSFRAAQAVEIALAACLPPLTYRAARSLGATTSAALVAASLAGLGGAFAPGWVSLDAFAPAAVVGTLFLLSYRTAAAGSLRGGALAGLAVGLLYLARAEGALFGLALLALLRTPATRRAGLVGSAVALAIGLAWLGRDLALGGQPDLVARSALLVRYEDFWATADPLGRGSPGLPTWDRFVAALPEVLWAKLAALGTNALTFVFAFGLLLLPGLGGAIRALGARAEVRAFAVLLGLVFALESLVFTLHSTHGSYFHSLAAFFPFGVALGVVGSGRLLRGIPQRRIAAAGGIAAALVISAFAVIQWDAAFDPPYRARLAAAPRIPAGLFMAVDAAAWRWIADRPVVVTPVAPDPCAIEGLPVTALVLERAHFSGWDALYAGGPGPAGYSGPERLGDIEIFRVAVPAAGGCAGRP